jgi:mono/diheme cytochrome c family protein
MFGAPARVAAAGFCLLVFLSSCGKQPEEAPAAAEARVEAGRKAFLAYCAPCHHAEGIGTEGGPPPLAGSPWVSGSEERLVRIVLHGVHGSLRVRDRTYNLEMPGFGKILGDVQIADILSFVRGRFGAPSPPVAPASVARARAATRDREAYWTAAELLAVE